MSESENSSPAPESQSPPEAAPATTATEANQSADNEAAPANNEVTPANESEGAPPASTNKNGPKITAGVSALKGSRPTMEDAHAVVDNVTIEGFPPEKTIGFFGVYDGHGGQHCAEFTKKYLHECILRDKLFTENTNGGDNTDEEVFDCMKRGFSRADKIITDIARIEKWNDGCTVAAALVYGNRVYIGNLGDAEIALVRKPAASADGDEDSKATGKCLTYRHKPSSPEERKRIEEAGGHVVFGRVMGTLAVSRAFGDFEFKVPTNKSKADYVSSDPYLAVEELTEDDVALIVACDGVWDVLKYDDAAQLVYEQMTKFKKTPGEAAHALITRALEKASRDNVSAIVVYMKWE